MHELYAVTFAYKEEQLGKGFAVSLRRRILTGLKPAQ